MRAAASSSALLALAAAVAAVALPSGRSPAGAASPGRRVALVDPFVGTIGMGHTYPGATVPFGTVQLSPDTSTAEYTLDGKTYDRGVYRYCAGYQHGDPTIVGFSHTHFHGTGHSDLGDFLLMPTVGPLRLEPGRAEEPGSGYRSRYDPASETASPGYYSVRLTDAGVLAEVTATTRVGVHRYTFPRSEESRLVLDLARSIYGWDGKVTFSRVAVRGPALVTGYRHTRGWARDRQLYFAMAFSKPFRSWGARDAEVVPYRGFWRKWDVNERFPEMTGRKLAVHFDFETGEGEAIVVRLALSAVSEEGALANLEAEVPHSDFDRVRAEAEERWEKELARVDFAGTEGERRVFYTALYHAFLSPVEYQDVDGRYRGADRAVHRAEGFTNHTVFSLWDTYRALHPLFTLLQPRRTSDLVRSLLAHFDESPWKLLPVWSFHANETWCMTGYHAVPVIADAWLKGIRGFDGEKAWEAVTASATHPGYDGLGGYVELGWVPDDTQTSSASKTLEYAYDDWTIANFARSLGKEAEAEAYLRRARSGRNLWDPSTGFFRARRRDGSFRTPFDPLATEGQGYIEGNAWNYLFHVPHDVAWLVERCGGDEAFAARLDRLFTTPLDEAHIAGTEDLDRAGFVGSYAHGNEPSHHVPYLYAFAGMPWRTQERVREIRRRMYRDAPDGLGGNDDCGQMSAWYLFSALGFYPVAPGSGEYVLGVPASREAVVHLGDGRRLVIRAPELSERNVWVQGVRLNGKRWEKSYVRHEDLAAGGELLFEMGPKPNTRFGRAPADRPSSLPVSK